MGLLIGLRKFTYGLIFLAISLILLMFDIVTGPDWIKYNKEVAVAFMATNIGEHLINLGKEYFKDKVVDRVLRSTKGND